MEHIFDIIMIPMQLIVIFFTLYYLIIAVFGLKKGTEHKILTPKNRFAIVIAAHNEAFVVGQLVENLHILDYPTDLYDIFVVADNCTDQTASISKKAGATVLERFHPTKKGKGFALEWAFAKIFRMDKAYDAVVIFDADNLVHPQFLTEMNSRLCKGEQVIQGYLDSKNPHDTWISGTFTISFWIFNHIWNLAKYNLGLSCALGGTGMCISTDILRKFGWQSTCLTEDLEFTMRVLLQGIRTTWAHDAIVYDEKPLTFMQSWHQRKRWAQGHFDVANRFIPTLLQQAFRKQDIRLLDGVLHLLQPHFLILSFVFLLCSYLNFKVPFYTVIMYQILPMPVWQMVYLCLNLIPLIILYKVRAKGKSWLYVFLYPIFAFSWIPITYLGFRNRHDREWSHTLHTRSIAYKEIM